MRRLTFTIAALAAALLTLGLAMPAAAHDEREVTPPDGSGSVPTYRAQGPSLLVCKTDKGDFDHRIAAFADDLKAADTALWNQCQTAGYRNLQEAVNAANQPGTNIKILPGVYLEEPSLADPTGDCVNLAVLSFAQQVACPNAQNLVAILNKTNLQIEGTGAKPDDVVIDAQFKRLNAIRADHSPGIYLRNFTAQHTTFNAVSIMESDGFAIDKVIGRWNDEFGFATVADDHGLYSGCEAYGNGSAGINTAATSNINANQAYDVLRYAVEIRQCNSHHNLIGYSGTAGDSVWAHDNVFVNNSTGISTGSLATDLPGLPQNHALFENNVIGDNNSEYYRYVRDGTCAKAAGERGYDTGVVCPAVGAPVGTGVLTLGGDYDVFRGNYVYANSYAGFVTGWVPGIMRDDHRIKAQFDTSHHNSYYDNRLGAKPDGTSAANGLDVWWDGQGVSDCWQSPAGGSQPRALPACNADHRAAGLGTGRYIAEPAMMLMLYSCTRYDRDSGHIPSDCAWYGATGMSRIEVKWALGESILLGLLLLILWPRLLGGSRIAAGGALATLAGLVLGVFGTLRPGSLYGPVSLAVVGLGWLGVGIALRRRGRPGLGFLTLAVGFFALLGAVDQAFFPIPYIPVPPSLWRIVLELFWVPAAIIAIVRGRVLAAVSERIGPKDALEAFAARLRF